jgi:crotonobetainyl-CoA:carnitine CoA-transferase CaiB-like acyl-CoA transferase
MSDYDDHTIPPIRPGGDQAFHTAASFANIAVGLALVQRQASGNGSLLDISMHEAAGVSTEIANPYWFYPRVVVKRQTCRSAQPIPTQPAIFQCMDRRWVYFSLILSDQKPWSALVQWMTELDLAGDLAEPGYGALMHRQANFGHIQDLLEVFFLLQDSLTAYHEGQARGLPIGIINAPEELYADEHLKARGFFVDVEQPGYGPVLHPGVPYRFSHLATAAPRPAPTLGQHTREVLGSLRDGPRSPRESAGVGLVETL